MNLLQNIINNYLYIKNDFLDVSFNISGVFLFFLNIVITLGILVLFYLFGDKLRRKFFKEIKEYNFFVSVALGYIAIGTGIGLLGLFSLLQPSIVCGYLFSIVVFALFPLKRFNKNVIIQLWKKFTGQFKKKNNYIFLGVFCFIVISFLRLPVPDTGEDGYHTDLPRLYLSWHTSIHESQELLHVIPYPQLPEMTYLIPIFLGQKDATRFIHFGFYLLIILLLFSLGKDKKNSYLKFAPLLFVTAPLVIRYSTSQYTDFFAVYCFLLSVLFIFKENKKKNIILSGILFGAVMSAKVWVLVYLPIFLLYLFIMNKKFTIKKHIRISLIFIISAFSIFALWNMRALLITGNPFFPIFAKWSLFGESQETVGTFSSYIGINWKMFLYENMAVYSPLFFLGVIFSVIHLKKLITLIRNFPPSLFFVLLMIAQLFLQIHLGRYLLSWYCVAILPISAGIFLVLKNNLSAKCFFVIMYVILFSYYFLNTLFTLPYGFGWADQNKYLTRVLGRDNASYYDFDHLFNKEITKNDLVATYGLSSFYYANFSYIDIGYVFHRKGESFDLLKKNKITKVLIKGGDINWFCKTNNIVGCSSKRVKLLATYPADIKKYNLYLIQY